MFYNIFALFVTPGDFNGKIGEGRSVFNRNVAPNVLLK